MKRSVFNEDSLSGEEPNLEKEGDITLEIEMSTETIEFAMKMKELKAMTKRGRERIIITRIKEEEITTITEII